MVKEKEQQHPTNCTSKGLFFWNEKLTRNQISESEGLCVIVIQREYERQDPCPCCYFSSDDDDDDSCCSTAIPFGLSRLLNKDPSLISMLLYATLQFTPEEITRMANDINYDLFTKFQFSQPPQPRPPYVISLEIIQTLIDYRSRCSFILSRVPPPPPTPPVPSFCRFEKDWDEEEELLTNACSVSRTDYQADPYHNYSTEVIEYIYALREYTGEAEICPTKPPIAQLLPKGFVRVSRKRIHCQLSRNLMDDTCPVCYAAFEDKNEVIITNCLHEFHIHCLQTWLSKKNTCPSCRAVYPLHYSPLFNCRKRRPHHNILEEPHHNILKEPNGSRPQHNISEETNSKRHKHNILEPSV